jgi:hypothetical protein
LGVTRDFVKEFIGLQRILSYKGFYKGIYRVTRDFELQGAKTKKTIQGIE